MNERVHIVGIAGVGMSALAQAAAWRGYTVTGSDRYLDLGIRVEALDKLARGGIALFPQDGSGITPQTSQVVVSTAIEADNPDLIAAQRHHVPVIHRSTLLAHMLGTHRSVAVAGTSGKTTVTGMLGWILEQAGLDPFVVNGGSMTGWQDDRRVGSVRAGNADLWVFEADESDQSCLAFSPHTAVITNISHDHFSLEETTRLFTAFAQQVSGTVICGPGVRKQLLAREASLAEKLEAPECLFDDPAGHGFTWNGQRYTVPLLGRHNACNAFMAAALATSLGVSPTQIQGALRTFPGIERRLQIVGQARGATILDDYAHNPAKITASWRAVQTVHPRVLGIWRPHGFGPLSAMCDDLTAAFHDVMGAADHLFVLPVYYAGGTTARTLTAAGFVERLIAAGVNAGYAPDYDALKEKLRQIIQEEDAVLCMGARDPELPRFARSLPGWV
ncbi:MAG: hypothetical protein EOM20_05185 [Spartobacteria bacterium]|nr:hypothetical protein [Spartobacteria bacterium]